MVNIPINPRFSMGGQEESLVEDKEPRKIITTSLLIFKYLSVRTKVIR